MLLLFDPACFMATHHSVSLVESITQCCVVLLAFTTVPPTNTATLDTRHPPLIGRDPRLYTESLRSPSFTNTSPRSFVSRYAITFPTARPCLSALWVWRANVCEHGYKIGGIRKQNHKHQLCYSQTTLNHSFSFYHFKSDHRGQLYSQPRYSTRDFNQTQPPTKYITMGAFWCSSSTGSE